MKAEHQFQFRLLQPIAIVERKRDRVNMDFVVSIPLTWNKHDATWIIDIS